MSVSVVITHKDRLELLIRCVASIRKQKGGDKVEIIVIDDLSKLEVRSGLDGIDVDKIIFNENNMGAPYSRNLGIKVCTNKVVHLMDCDDYVLNADYDFISQHVIGSNVLYYAQIKSQGGTEIYPEVMTENKFVEYIVSKYKHIAQTSSLIFDKEFMFVRFDQTLPKHQDWDFVYSCLTSGVSVKKIDATIFFDRGDKKSVSRTVNYGKSLLWLEKMKINKDYDFLRFYLVSPDKLKYTNLAFFKLIVKFSLTGKLPFIDSLKLLYKRYLL